MFGLLPRLRGTFMVSNTYLHRPLARLRLGDPCCIWIEHGASPAFDSDLSNPGDAQSVPSTRKCLAVTCANGVDPCVPGTSASNTPIPSTSSSVTPSPGSVPTPTNSVTPSAVGSGPGPDDSGRLYPVTAVSIFGGVGVVFLAGLATISYGRQFRWFGRHGVRGAPSQSAPSPSPFWGSSSRRDEPLLAEAAGEIDDGQYVEMDSGMEEGGR